MTDVSTPSSSPEPLDDDALDARRPCPDGNCVGVADEHGVCTECGCFIGAPDEAGDVADSEEDRSPCPDGACIGVIGPDGVCTECGSEGSGDRSADDDDDDDDDDEWEEGADADADAEDDEDDERVPCSDGACIGIIGDDGTCSECGRTLEEQEA